MDNPFRPPNKGAARRPWSLSPKKKKKRYTIDKDGLPVPIMSPPDPSECYYQMIGPYHQPSSSQTDGSQAVQAQQSNPQNAIAGLSAPIDHPIIPGSVMYPYRPTDPKSIPRYLYRPAEPTQVYPQLPATAPRYIPAQPAIPVKFAEREPRFIFAAQTGPGQYVPAAHGPGLGGGVGPVIQAKQEKYNPFTTRGHHSGSADRAPPRDTDSFDRRFLKSLVEPHESDCSDLESDTDGDEPERFCTRNRSLSPSVLKKDRADESLARRVKELEGKIAQLQEEREMEVAELKAQGEKMTADVKIRAVQIVGDAAHEICGIERDSAAWESVISKAQEMMDEVTAAEKEGEAS